MILLVDDDPRFLNDAASTLVDGRRLIFARSATQAKDLMYAIGGSFSVALVDLCLPGTNGFELIRDLHREWPGMPIIAISGVTAEAALASATCLGAWETLRKPITPEWNSTIARARLQRSGTVE